MATTGVKQFPGTQWRTAEELREGIVIICAWRTPRFFYILCTLLDSVTPTEQLFSRSKTFLLHKGPWSY
jgi:hypothetical protein